MVLKIIVHSFMHLLKKHLWTCLWGAGMNKTSRVPGTPSPFRGPRLTNCHTMQKKNVSIHIKYTYKCSFLESSDYRNKRPFGVVVGVSTPWQVPQIHVYLSLCVHICDMLCIRMSM